MTCFADCKLALGRFFRVQRSPAPCGLLSERDRRIPGRRLDYEFQFRGSLIEIALGDRGNPAQDGVSALFAAACHSNRHSGRRVVGSQWDAHIQFTGYRMPLRPYPCRASLNLWPIRSGGLSYG